MLLCPSMICLIISVNNILKLCDNKFMRTETEKSYCDISYPGLSFYISLTRICVAKNKKLQELQEKHRSQ